MMNKTIGMRLTEEDEMRGADLVIPSIEAYPEGSVHVGKIELAPHGLLFGSFRVILCYS
jgi:hypothetical protein